MEAASSGADLLPPAEADWPPELRLPARPPPRAPASGMDDSQFLGSIMGEAPRQGPSEPPPQHLVTAAPRKRGRPPKKRDGLPMVAAAAAAPAKPARRREDEEEVVCFICFDGGNLVVCDRRGCPKVYHPACIKRDESFFNCRTKWNCGWHICSSCEKAVHYMCYTCTYSLCKVCIKQGKFFSVRGAKGFCDTCFSTILLIESKDEAATKVDFDDINSWEYLFKLYWLDLKGKLSLTLEELTSAKSIWTVPNTSTRKEKEESSDDLYDINNDDDAGSDCSSRKRRRNSSSKKKGRKRQKVNSDCSIAANKDEPAIRDAESLATKIPTEGEASPVDTKWASPELLEFVGHMRNGDQSFISQFEVQTDLLEYIKKNNLRDPKRKSQIICDARLRRLFRKARVAHFEMLKLLEMHFLVNQTSKMNDNSQVAIDLNSAQIDINGYSDMAAKLSPDKRRRIYRKMEREPQVNPEAYAAVDMHNINLIYMRRSLMEDLIDDAAFLEKIYGAFVRIKIPGVGQKQDMYRLVKVVGTHKVPEKYSVGKKTTNLALEILNLNKKEIITMDTISNQDFTEEECNRLRQSMKCGLIGRLKVGAVQAKAKVLQSVRMNDWLENEKQRLEHLRDRASETGRKKELRECVEKLQLLNNSEERTRRINEVLEVHADPRMDPNYESAEEMDDIKSVGVNANRTRIDTSVSRRKSKYPRSTLDHAHSIADANHHPKILSTESTMRESRTGRKFENFHHIRGTDIPRPSSTCEAGSVSSSVVTMSSETEPEKVWHYKDPLGNVQGPFTLLQLSKWTSYFPRDLRVWLTFESEERSLLLTEVLSKQQTVFTQTTSVTTSTKATSAGIECNKNSLSADQINALSPTGYSMLNSSVVTIQSNKYSVPERESVNSPEDCLSLSTSSIPPKYVHTLNSQVQCQTKHSVFVQSPGSPCGQTDLHHDGAHGGCSDESNHRHSTVTMKNSIMAHMSYNGKSNVTSHQDQHSSWPQNQNDSKSSSQGVSVRDMSKNLPTRVVKDAPSPLFAWSPSESRTASSQHDGSCLSSTTNPNFLDEHHSSIASTKPKCHAPATPIEDRGSSSPSGLLSHSERVPVCSPQSAPSASVSDVCKIEEMINQRRTLEEDTLNAPVNQSPESKITPVSSPDNQDIDREIPTPTPRPENKDPVVHSERVPLCSPQSAPSASVSDTCKTEEMMSQQRTLEEDTSNALVNQSPEPKICPVSSPDKKNMDREFPSPTPRIENKDPAVENLGLKPASPDNLASTCSPVSDSCKMEEIVNQHKILEAGTSNSPANHYPQSEVLHVSFSSDKDLEPESARSDNKESAVDNSLSTSAATENLRMTSAYDTDTCKMEATVKQQKAIEEDASIKWSPPPNIFPVSSTDNQDIERAYPNPAPRSGDPNLRTASAFDTDTCKMEATMNQQKTLEEDLSNASINRSPRSDIFPVSSIDNQDIQSAYPNPTPRSGSKEATENLKTASAFDTDTCRMEATMDQQKTREKDVSDASINRSPYSNTFPVSSTDNQEDIERACPSPTPICGNKEPSVDSSGLKSAAPENLSSATTNASNACKMESLDKKETIETDASGGLTTPPKVSLMSSPDNQDIEREFPGPAPESKNKELLVDNSLLTSATPENDSSTSASASDGCKMEMLDKKTTPEQDASNSSVAPSPRSEDFHVTSDNHGIQCEYPSPIPRPENKESVVDTAMLILAAPDDLTTKLPGGSPDACALPKSGPPTGKLDVMESDFNGVEEIIQNELYSESTVVTKENVIIDPSCGAESIDVSDVLESLMEQRCGIPYMHGTTSLEDFLAASPEEEPQCSSPIALSPWGAPSYYQGDAVDSALWGVEDDPVNDMWSLLSPTPTLQPSSGLGTKESETLDVNEVAVSHGINEFFQRGPVLGEENVKNAVSNAATDWVLPEQVKSKSNDVSASSVDETTGIVGWQLSANQNLCAATASGTGHNLYLPGCEKAVIASKSSWEVSRKQESTDSSVSSSGEAIGNTNKSWNPPSVTASRGIQKNHRRGRYSEISESWLLSSNNSRSRSDRFGSGGSSKSNLNGQSRGVCKFHEGGYCRKGASCSYLHP